MSSPVSEFDLIRRYFSRPVPAGVLGPGDDCALLPAAAGPWAISTDLLLAGRHFFADVDPARLGHKALAVNLSDLAAMGAMPRGCVLGLALPAIDPDWLAAFADGWYALAAQAQCPLVGGDTTRSESGLAISVTVFGEITPAGPLRRDAARVGDDIWVSGALGAAHVALQLSLHQRGLARSGTDPLARWLADLTPAQVDTWWQRTRDALELPQPRLALGQALAPLAHAALDISDGLLQDLGHIVQASACAALIQAPALPVGPLRGMPAAAAWQAALGGGDDYELCFTAAPAQRAAIAAAAQRVQVPVRRIGHIVAGDPQVVVHDDRGHPWSPPLRGFDHFIAAS